MERSERVDESPTLDVDTAVRSRYSQAAEAAEASLCCPVQYNPAMLEIIPEEIIERDYGCGDPSRWIQPGETVLDLGSGGGKICYIAAQVVGAEGRVIGVDCNDEMLSLARKYQPTIAERLRYANVEFRKGQIQDLRLDQDLFDAYLAEQPPRDSRQWQLAEVHAETLRKTSPLVADDSVDVVVSNCVLNLVRRDDRRQLFAEVLRVLRRGGRAVISDIVSDADVPMSLQNDPRLWSGCLSGAFREDEFLAAFEAAGFYGIEILTRQEEPWGVIDGIEFRSMTVRAFKGKDGPCLERNQAVVYQGPWKTVTDDNGHEYRRGERMAVCDKTFRILTQAPYADCITPIEPAETIPLESARPFVCDGPRIRTPEETRQRRSLDILPGDGDCCGPGECC